MYPRQGLQNPDPKSIDQQAFRDKVCHSGLLGLSNLCTSLHTPLQIRSPYPDVNRNGLTFVGWQRCTAPRCVYVHACTLLSESRRYRRSFEPCMKRPDLLEAVMTVQRVITGCFSARLPNRANGSNMSLAQPWVACGSLEADRSCLRHVSAQPPHIRRR